MAQTWRSGRGEAGAGAPPPLDGAALERLALRYVERYATTRAKLRRYLERKVRERGWGPDEPPQIDIMIAKFAELGYVDDAAFATARGASLTRRGYGARRVLADLRAAGIDEQDAEAAQLAAREAAWEAALTYARRKRIGPFAAVAADRAGREKALAAMLRGGHDMRLARQIVAAQPGTVPELDAG